MSALSSEIQCVQLPYGSRTDVGRPPRVRLTETIKTEIGRGHMLQAADPHSLAVTGPHWESWLASDRAPEGSRKRGERIAGTAILDS